MPTNDVTRMDFVFVQNRFNDVYKVFLVFVGDIVLLRVHLILSPRSACVICATVI